MGGFDMEYGYNLNIPNTMTYLTYYHFANKDEKQSIDGARIRLEYKLTDILKLEGEYSYDNSRKSAYYGGFSVNIALGTKTKKLSTLMKKMTQLPVRDVDVVTVVVESIKDNQLHEFIMINSAQEFAKISNPAEVEYSLDSKYVQIFSFNMEGINHIPIGTKLFPFTGEYYGIYNGRQFSISNIQVESYAKNVKLGMFGVINSAVIHGVSLINSYVQGKGEYSSVGILVGEVMGQNNKITYNNTFGIAYGGNYTKVGNLIGEIIGTFNVISHNTTEGYAWGGTKSQVSNLVGGISGKHNVVTFNTTSGKVIGGDNSYVGNLVGIAKNKITITNNTTTGDATGGNNSIVSNLIGMAHCKNTITENITSGNAFGGDNSTVSNLVGVVNLNNTIICNIISGKANGGANSKVGSLIVEDKNSWSLARFINSISYKVTSKDTVERDNSKTGNLFELDNCSNIHTNVTINSGYKVLSNKTRHINNYIIIPNIDDDRNVWPVVLAEHNNTSEQHHQQHLDRAAIWRKNVFQSISHCKRISNNNMSGRKSSIYNVAPIIIDMPNLQELCDVVNEGINGNNNRRRVPEKILWKIIEYANPNTPFLSTEQYTTLFDNSVRSPYQDNIVYSSAMEYKTL